MIVALVAALAIPPLPATPELGTLLEGLRSRDAAVRLDAVESLSALGEGARPAVPALIARLRDREVSVRVAAALALGNTRSEEAIPGLARALEDVPPVGAHAAMALWMIGPRSRPVANRLRAIVLMAPRDDFERARHRNVVGALRTVGVRGKDIGPLRTGLRNPSPQVRFSSARLLGFADRADRRALKDLERVAAQDDHADVRRAAADAYEWLKRCAASDRPCRPPAPAEAP